MNGNTASPEGFFREDDPEAPRHDLLDELHHHIPKHEYLDGFLQMDQEILNWNMPGAFRTDMDIDNSPKMENGQFADSTSALGSAMKEDEFMQFLLTQFPDQGLQENPQHSIPQSQQSQQGLFEHDNGVSPFGRDSFSGFDKNYPESFQGSVDHQVAGISPAKAFGSMVGDSPQAPSSVDFGLMPNHTPEAEEQPIRSRRNTQSHRTSFSAMGEFLPLTTTTSLTPSMNSMYLAQASFFSASQFRLLFDQPPSLNHRPSFDVYPRGRVSIDSQGSSINPPSRNPRSFSSYIPFMGERDRDRKLPDWGQQPQSKHLIRSIFKSNNEPQEDDPAPFLADVLVNQDEEVDPIENPAPSKKARRTRMNLFNRFKTQRNQVLEAQPELVKHETHSSVTSSERDDSSHQNSVVQHSLQNSVKTENSSNLGNAQMFDSQLQPLAEPDYASLFENMGKRRLGGMKNKKPTVKQENESGITSSVSATEKSSLNNVNRLSAEQSGDSGLMNDISLSQHSSYSEEGAPGGSLSFANASKRILGLRLLKKKAQQSKAEQQQQQQSDLVEIDLQSLDLPPDTEIIPTINPKVRTRGRKENKAADLVDLSKIFVCTYCLRRFKRQEHLKRHFRSLHTSEKPYECPMCQKKFSRTDNLNQHIKVHKQEEEEEAAARAAMVIKEEDTEV